MRKMFISLVMFCCVGCVPIYTPFPDTEEVQDVSIIQLIANPNTLHHKKVRVIGFAVIRFERTALYLSKELADYGSSKDAIWLNIENIEQLERFKQDDGTYVLVEGIFDQEHLGHLSSYSGAITHITRFEQWRKTK